VRSQSSGPIPEKNNHMKKYITFHSIAYAMSLLTFVLVASMLCSACMQLHERTHSQTTNLFDELEKSLVLERKYLDTVNKQWVFEYSVK
jgi:hypothetical protein